MRAELYDLVHRGSPGDLDFYLRQCAGDLSVLELGCGSGRVLAALSQGARCVGVDLDAAFLQLARVRCAKTEPALVCADMGRFAFEAHFDRILIPYNGLYCLRSEARVLACLRSAARHLAPGGRVIFDVYEADVFHESGEEESGEEQAPEDDDEPVVCFERAGELIEVYERSRWRRSEQRIDVVYDYCAASGERIARIEIPHRYLLLRQIVRLIREAGLELRALYDAPEGDALVGASEAGLPEIETDWIGVVARAPRPARPGV